MRRNSPDRSGLFSFQDVIQQMLLLIIYSVPGLCIVGRPSDTAFLVAHVMYFRCGEFKYTTLELNLMELAPFLFYKDTLI